MGSRCLKEASWKYSAQPTKLGLSLRPPPAAVLILSQSHTLMPQRSVSSCLDLLWPEIPLTPLYLLPGFDLPSTLSRFVIPRALCFCCHCNRWADRQSPQARHNVWVTRLVSMKWMNEFMIAKCLRIKQPPNPICSLAPSTGPPLTCLQESGSRWWDSFLCGVFKDCILSLPRLIPRSVFPFLSLLGSSVGTHRTARWSSLFPHPQRYPQSLS